MKPNLGITDEGRREVIRILGDLLADEYVLYTKTRDYHWNVVGPRFAPLHALFEGQYGQLEEVVDEVAERIRQLGDRAPGTLSEFRERARLKEVPGDWPDADGMLANLLSDHEAVVRTLRDDLRAAGEDHGDTGTEDFLTGLMERHEKIAWMLRAHLEQKGR